MKPHPRIRKTIKWGGAAATLLLLVAWIASGWWFLRWTSGGRVSIVASAGVVTVLLERRAGWVIDPPGWQWGQTGAPMLWWFAGVNQGRDHFYLIPLWSLVAPTLLITAAAWRADAIARRRARALLNLCAKCNYNRAGLAAGAKCPECGTEPRP